MNYVLVIIMLAVPQGQNGGYADSLVIDNFKTLQECQNALSQIEIPKLSTSRVDQGFTKQCVAKSL